MREREGNGGSVCVVSTRTSVRTVSTYVLPPMGGNALSNDF